MRKNFWYYYVLFIIACCYTTILLSHIITVNRSAISLRNESLYFMFMHNVPSHYTIKGFLSSEHGAFMPTLLGCSVCLLVSRTNVKNCQNQGYLVILAYK